MTSRTPPASDDAVSTDPPATPTMVQEKPAKNNVKKQNATVSAPSKRADAETLERLARQLEYYFSVQNLSRDTYVNTLRSLNEGYVPATILANFGKIKTILSFSPGVDPLEACLEAAESYSTLLQVAHVDKETNKIVPEEQLESACDVRRQSRFIACIGLPKGKEPIALTPNTSKRLAPMVSPASIPSPSVQPNRQTIILRDVPSSASQEEIRAFFDPETVVSVNEDVSNTWFVILEGSRDDILTVLLGLRVKAFSTGESIKARLKTATTIPATAILPPVFDPTQIAAANKGSHVGSSKSQQQSRRNGAKQNQKSNNRSGQQKNGSSNNVEKSKTSSSTPSNPATTRRKQTSGSSSSNKQQQKPKTPPARKSTTTPPPKLTEEWHFPTLGSPKTTTLKETVVVDTNDKVIKSPPVEKTGLAGPHSDTSSTATASSTTSSQAIMDTQPAPSSIGGYAAALLRTSSVPSPVQETKEVVKIGENGKNRVALSSESSTASTRDSDTQSVASATTSISTSAAAPKPTWGGGVSFADVLKQSNTTPSATLS